MVRTSDFQSENAGSIPSDPTYLNNTQMLSIISNNEKRNKKNIQISSVKYSFFFISIISPYIINNVKLLSDYDNDERKIFIKQSYILLTWFYYISSLTSSINSKKKLKIAVLPTKRKIFTLTKAPMAHKTWSKEQYKFQYYKFKISFVSSFKDNNSVTSVNSALLFSLLAKKNISNFETNVFFLKSFSFFFFFKDVNFFNYYKFLV